MHRLPIFRVCGLFKEITVKQIAAAATFLFAVSMWAQSNQSAPNEQVIMPDPPMLGAYFARGVVPPQVARGVVPPSASAGGDLIYHNGPIMGSAVVTPIFWGTTWNPNDPKIAGLRTWYGGVGGTRYAGTNSEYKDSTGSNFGGGVSFDGNVAIDNSAAPKRAPRTSTIQSEVCKLITNPVVNGYYPVYIDQRRGHAGYCAWHSWGSCSGVNVQFAFFFNLDGDAGCDPQDTQSGHSQGLAAVANVSGHELSEAVTDPRGTGWFDSSGAENGDKCAWTFSGVLVNFNNGTSWKIQGNYSNAAAAARSGYDGAGCIDGN
jgi:hypothetical protein